MNDTIDERNHTIHFERTFEAPPEQVFDAWTQSEQVSHWWDPTGTPLAACAIDLRPNGRFHFATVGHAPPFEGSYAVIDRPRRIEFEAMGAKGIVALQPLGTGTWMHVSIRCASAEHFEMFLKLGVHTGTSTTLDNLVAHLRPSTQVAPLSAGRTSQGPE